MASPGPETPTSWFRGQELGLGGSVLAPASPAILDTLGIQGAPDHVVTHAGQVLNPATPYEDHRVLLEVVPFATDIGRNLYPVGKPDTGNLSERRIGFLWRHGPHLDADASALRATLAPFDPVPKRVLHPMQCRSLGSLADRLASLSDQLVNCRHSGVFLVVEIKVPCQRNSILYQYLRPMSMPVEFNFGTIVQGYNMDGLVQPVVPGLAGTWNLADARRSCAGRNLERSRKTLPPLAFQANQMISVPALALQLTSPFLLLGPAVWPTDPTLHVVETEGSALVTTLPSLHPSVKEFIQLEIRAIAEKCPVNSGFWRLSKVLEYMYKLGHERAQE